MTIQEKIKVIDNLLQILSNDSESSLSTIDKSEVEAVYQMLNEVKLDLQYREPLQLTETVVNNNVIHSCSKCSYPVNIEEPSRDDILFIYCKNCGQKLILPAHQHSQLEHIRTSNAEQVAKLLVEATSHYDYDAECIIYLNFETSEYIPDSLEAVEGTIRWLISQPEEE